MKKRKHGRTLSRVRSQRIALLRTLFVSLIKYKRIETTLAKAKELKPFAEKMVTRAKKEKAVPVSVMRLLKKDLPVVAIKELLNIANVVKDRKGGYLRIIKTTPRKSDQADMAIVEWVDEFSVSESSEEKKDKKAEKKDAPKKAVEKKEEIIKKEEVKK